jgi:hypothetical protein
LDIPRCALVHHIPHDEEHGKGDEVKPKASTDERDVDAVYGLGKPDVEGSDDDGG